MSYFAALPCSCAFEIGGALLVDSERKADSERYLLAL